MKGRGCSTGLAVLGRCFPAETLMVRGKGSCASFPVQSKAARGAQGSCGASELRVSLVSQSAGRGEENAFTLHFMNNQTH